MIANSSFEGPVAPTEKKPQPNPTQLEKTGNPVAVVVEVLSFSTRTACNQSQLVAHQ